MLLLLNLSNLLRKTNKMFGKLISFPQLVSPVENQNDLELDFKVFFFVDSCC